MTVTSFVRRRQNPASQEFTWWRFNVGAREQKKGWRYDYAAVSDHLIGQVVDVQHLVEIEDSDDCPVLLKIRL